MHESVLQRIRNFFRNDRSGGGEIDPSEIFIDAHNLPDFDTTRFEGRIEKPITSRTLVLLGVACFLIGSGLIWRVLQLQIVHGAEYSTLSENNHLHNSIIFAERGIIVDRNDVKLAWNVPITENASGTPEEYSSRAYTDTNGFAHILGYVNFPLKDSVGFFYRTASEGLAGVEKTYDALLSGVPGHRIVETDAHLHVTSQNTLDDPQNGKTLTLSIDSRVQKALQGFLGDLVEKIPFDGGAGVIMDVHTGEVLALTSYPEFNSQLVTKGSASAMTRYLQDPRKPFIDRVVGGVYTPGSVIKPFIALGALNEGVISPTKTILSTGTMLVDNPYDPSKPSIFRDWRPQGEVDMRHAISVSSDIYFYEVGGGYKDQKGLGIRKIEKYARLFGFGTTTGIDLVNEQVGTIPNPEWKAKNFEDGQWRVGDTYFTAIGQYGFQVTPIQMVRGIAAIANGGSILVPRLRKVTEGEQVTPLWHVDILAQDFTVVQEGMRLSAQEGTAAGLNNPYLALAAKTGTAELGVKKDFVNSWVVGYFPYDHPRYAFAVLLEHGHKGNTFGGVYVMRQLLDWMHVNTPEYLSTTTTTDE